MALQATFVADFTRWNTALANAQANLKPLEVSAKGVQRQLENMAKSFSGVDIKKQADLAVAAVKSIGGAASLTESEQRKVNATVTEAIAKYRALGQQAPAELRKLQAETARAAKDTGLLGTAAGKAGALLAATFTVGAVTSAISNTVAYASSIKDMANQTGIGVERLQELKFAAEQSGVSFDSVGTAIFNVQKSLGKGGDGVTGALSKLGISLKEIKGLSPEDQFTLIARKLGDVKSESDRVRIGTELMGKSFKDVLPLIREGIDAQIAKAREWGVVIDANAIDALENMGDAWDAVKLKGTALIAQALVPMVPAITALLNSVGPLVAKFSELPSVFSKVEIAFNRLIQKQAEGAVELLQLSKLSPLGLANLATGQIDKQIGEARLVAAGYRGIVNGLVRDAVRDATVAKIALAKLGEVRVAPPSGGGGGNGPSDEEIKRFQKWRDDVTGAATDKALQQLTDDWNKLTAAERASQPVRDKVMAQYAKLRVELTTVGGALEALRTENLKALQPLEGLSSLFQSLSSRWLPDATAMFTAGQSAIDGMARSGALLSSRLVPITVQMQAMPPAIQSTAVAATDAALRQQEAADAAEAWRERLDDVAQAFATLSQASDGTLSRIFAGIGKVVGSANLMVKSVDSIKKGISGIDQAKNLGQTIAGFAELTAGILGAAAAAIELGTALYDAFTKSRAEQTAERIGREFGVAVSEEFAKTIEDQTAKFFGNRQAAQIFNLDKIIAEGGGLSAENIRPMFARFRDLFSMVETGAFSSAQAIEVLDKNFRQFADFVTEGGSLASKELVDIINLTERFGLKSAEVSAFVVQETGKALGGLTTFLKNAKVTTQAAADGITAALFGIFEAQSGNGVPAADIIRQLDPLIKQLDEQLITAGLSGGESFRLIKELAAVASNEIAGPLITGVIGLEQALAGLNNAGVLNEEMFDGLTASVADTYAQILATGVDGSKALQLIGPTLQTIWELQQDFGYSVEDTTQALLDEAAAAGLVGDRQRTAQEQMLRLTERMTDAVEYLAKTFGYVTDEVEELADAINDIADPVITPRINWPDMEPPGGWPQYPTGESSGYDPSTGDPDPSNGYAYGGLVQPKYFAGGGPVGSDTVPIWATPGEFVMRKSAVDRIGADTLSAMNSGTGWGGGSQGGPVTVNVTIQAWDGTDVARVVKGREFADAFVDAQARNTNQLRTRSKAALGV